MDAELECNKYAGRDHFVRYYNKKHLARLAQFQRNLANSQIAALKRRLVLSVSAPRTSGRRVVDLQSELEALAVLTEMREEPSGEHSFRVGRIAAALARVAGLDEKSSEMLASAARLHDIGKLAIPDAILLKRGKLSATEREIIERHTTEGSQMLTDLVAAVEQWSRSRRTDNLETLRLAAEIAYHHHEWWDGSGYPRGINGEKIPLGARITAIADVYDELTHTRPYKTALTSEQAMHQICSLSGKQFDPHLCTLLANAIGMIETGEVKEPKGSDNLPFVRANRVLRRIVTPLVA